VISVYETTVWREVGKVSVKRTCTPHDSDFDTLRPLTVGRLTYYYYAVACLVTLDSLQCTRGVINPTADSARDKQYVKVYVY